MSEAKQDLKFEEALKRLEGIISLLESGRADLETSLSSYEEGVHLLRVCRSKLNDAEQKIECLKRADAELGVLETAPLDPEELRSDAATAGRSVSAKKSSSSMY